MRENCTATSASLSTSTSTRATPRLENPAFHTANSALPGFAFDQTCLASCLNIVRNYGRLLAWPPSVGLCELAKLMDRNSRITKAKWDRRRVGRNRAAASYWLGWSSLTFWTKARCPPSYSCTQAWEKGF